MKTLTSNQIDKVLKSLGKYLNVTNWKDKRIYIKGYGYNTKKCKQNIYIDLTTLNVVCHTECDSQPTEWCQSQSNIVVDDMEKYSRLAKIVAYVNRDINAEANSYAEVVEAMVNDSQPVGIVEDTNEVFGYTTRWEEVRIAINRFGKLATRNRQFLSFVKTTRFNAPYKFVEISENDFNAIAIKNGKIIEDIMLDAYEEPASRINSLIEYYNFKVEAIEMLAADLEEKKLAEIENEAKKQEKILELAAKMKGVDGAEALNIWKIAGFPQPCPAIVQEFKMISGLSWKDFKNTIK